jgi:peptide deformylase
MICDIIRLGNPLLREICAEVRNPREAAETVASLADTLRHSRETTGYGRAIAAPQIGILQRVIFLNVEGNRPWPLINPVITARSEETIVVWDACLSFLSIFMQVRRHKFITVRYQDPDGVEHEVEAGPERDLAELLQHEIDHLDGILCIDRVEDLRTVCSKEEFEIRYKSSSPYAEAGA